MSTETNQRSRKFLLTINNPKEHDLDHDSIKKIIKTLDPSYWSMCDETGIETGTYHTHLFLLFANARKWESIKAAFYAADIRNCKGTAQENRDYITKTGEKWENSKKECTNHPETFEESGSCPQEKQGQRNDLSTMYQDVIDQKPLTEILTEKPGYGRYIHSMKLVRDEFEQERQKQYLYKRRDVKVTYLYGAPRTGKTTYIFEKHGYHNVYRVTDYDRPFDTYNGEKVLLLDEYRDSLALGFLLSLLEGVPMTLSARFRNRIPCWEYVYIVSNWEFEQQHNNAQTWQYSDYLAFKSRIHRIISIDDIVLDDLEREAGFTR